MSPSSVNTRWNISAFFAALLLLASPAFSQSMVQSATPSSGPAKELVLQFDPAQSGADITLPTALHTVEGTFALKRGTVHYDAATGKTSGEIVFDATSGKTGNGSRDNKMHKDVIESSRYTEIYFHPDHVEGTLAPTGSSALKIHGMFGIHGAEHELTMPVDFSRNGTTWTATSAFQVPFVQWGMKDPSVFILRVNKIVQVKMHAGGSTAP
jgi:polyisoprenoid-binding protein YceI